MESRKELMHRRLSLNLTHDVVASRAQISRSYYTNIEIGRKDPSIKVAKKIADVMNTTVDEIFFDGCVPIRNQNIS